MATTKKKPATKARTAKTSATKVRSSTPRKKSSKKQEIRSFRVAKPDTPFLTFSITRQTLYWLVLAGVVLVFGLWLIKLQSDIQAIYDSIDATNAEQIDMPVKKKQ